MPEVGKKCWQKFILDIIMTDHVEPLDSVLHQTEVLEVVKDGEDAIDILKIILIE